jgi:hypothetical protein
LEPDFSSLRLLKQATGWEDRIESGCYVWVFVVHGGVASKQAAGKRASMREIVGGGATRAKPELHGRQRRAATPKLSRQWPWATTLRSLPAPKPKPATSPSVASMGSATMSFASEFSRLSEPAQGAWPCKHTAAASEGMGSRSAAALRAWPRRRHRSRAAGQLLCGTG